MITSSWLRRWFHDGGNIGAEPRRSLEYFIASSAQVSWGVEPSQFKSGCPPIAFMPMPKVRPEITGVMLGRRSNRIYFWLLPPFQQECVHVCVGHEFFAVLGFFRSSLFGLLKGILLVWQRKLFWLGVCGKCDMFLTQRRWFTVQWGV